MKTITPENYKKVLKVDDVKDINWKHISINQKLSEDFIKEFKHQVNWSSISQFQNLSKNFIKEFKDKVDWYNISTNQKLSEDFIREFKDKVNWNCISYYQTLSEDFIREFQDQVNWYYISYYQNLSKNFLKEFKDKIKDCILLKSVHYCGKHNRVIYINNDKPKIIHIGCFKGTKEEAIEAVSEKYKYKDKEKYISQIEECFNY